ncbi:MAG: class I SAM-dependent methyltransferase [Candidatus Glassbacteria bacterium]
MNQKRVQKEFWEDYLDTFDSFYETKGFLNLFRRGALRKRFILTFEYLESQGAHASRVLEVGCGMGRLTVELLREGHSVICNDITQRAIQVTQARIEEAVNKGYLDETIHRNLSFVVGDAVNTEFPEADFCIALGVIDYIGRPTDFLTNVRKSSPHFLFTFPMRYHWKTIPRKIIEKPKTYHYTLQEMKRLCNEAGFQNVSFLEDIGGHFLIGVKP